MCLRYVLIKHKCFSRSSSYVVVRRQKNKFEFQWTDCWFLVLSIRNLEVTILKKSATRLGQTRAKDT